MKRIFDYLDYREFLRDYYEEKKSENSYLLWYLGYHLHLDPEFLRKVIEGRSHLPEKTLPLIKSFFKLTKQESRYLRVLFWYSNAETFDEVTRLYKKLKRTQECSLRAFTRLKLPLSQRHPYPVMQTSFQSRWEHALAGSTFGQYFYR